ncbi:hypothetical protein QVD17_04447 [Tagetes erecta]|uniref:Uncharacterized protein n=1 Tax=Tagetes erecta TaxID=13708 RepID=A0AAD8LFI7_TARER|nr:hypothetical protein QVD17_04447 [Tagetes erecta]
MALLDRLKVYLKTFSFLKLKFDFHGSVPFGYYTLIEGYIANIINYIFNEVGKYETSSIFNDHSPTKKYIDMRVKERFMRLLAGTSGLPETI